jgi:DNA-binding Lrp family transcriptional regulator
MDESRSLTPLERRIIYELQQDLPVVTRPFAVLAEKLGISEAELLEKVRELVADGTIRRFGATLRHQRSGFDANAMVVWEVEAERAAEVGVVFASFREVTHCYQRPAMPNWPYRLFTMIHGPSRQVCREIAQRMAEASGVKHYDLLFTEEELKKTTMAYFADAASEAGNNNKG